MVGESNGHMIDHVIRPCLVKVVSPMCLGPIMWKTAGDTDSVVMEHL